MARYLKRNCGTEAPSSLIFVDCETRTEERKGIHQTTVHKLRLWYATRVRLEKGKVTRRKEAFGTDSADFWRFVDENSDSHRCTWIFAHNLSADLTWLDLWHLLDCKVFTTAPMKSKSLGIDGRYKNSWTGKLCLDNHPFWMQVRRGRKTYKFVDSMNYWPMSLEKVADGIGLEKTPLPDQSESDHAFLIRCKNDVEILEVAICDLIRNWLAEDCGVFQATAASLAMNNYRHRSGSVIQKSRSIDIVCPGSSAQTVLERESYFGGRIQAFFVGERHHKIYHLDCNSLYPYVMRNYLYPRRLVSVERGISSEKLLAISKVYGVVARVAINSRYSTFPVRIEGKQYHCIGRFWTTLSGRELVRAVTSSSISKVATAQVYSVAPLFRDWVDYWFNRKVEAERIGSRGKADREFAKLILNSLSGKWAQHGRRWEDCPGRIPYLRWGGWVEGKSSKDGYKRFRGIGGSCQKLTEGKEPDHAFPAISAFITSAAREYMRHVISLCPEGSVYYMATDSLICGHDAFEALTKEGYIHHEELGKFKINGVHKYLCINGPNDYILDATQVLSGPIGKAASDGNGILRAEMWDRSTSVIAKGPTNEIEVRNLPVFYPSHTNRGRVREDGYWEPYRITDDTIFTDRPRKGGYFSGDLPDMEVDHIQQDAWL